MEIGTVLPQIEIGVDPGNVLEYTRRIERAGYEHLLAYDHVVGVDPDREGWDGPYDYEDTFHEPLTTFSYLAGETTDITFVTGVLVLPQRNTAVVAKQAAQLDRIADGRLRLGVGVGWNEPEYVALGEEFSTRGRRIEEQIEVLRRLWTDELVDYEGEFHTIPTAGINPLPIQQPIPLWMGGSAEVVKRRVARMADGWMPQFQPDEAAEAELESLYSYAEEFGRDPDEIGIHGRMYAIPGEEDDWIERANAWKELGADYLSISTMYQGFDSPEAHAEHLEKTARTLSDAGLF